jgi:hypothetical protein
MMISSQRCPATTAGWSSTAGGVSLFEGISPPWGMKEGPGSADRDA